jgi:uncharacterized protein DUF5666
MMGKVFAGIAAAGVLAAVLTTGVMAAPAATPAASPTTKQRPAPRDVFAGTVTAINERQVTVRNARAGSKTFLRTDATVVVEGLKAKSSWSEIGINSHVAIRYEARDGKLYAKGVRIGRTRVAGQVQAVNGNIITLRTREGKDLKLTVNNSTKYVQLTGKKQRQAGSLKDIHAGTRLIAAGRYDSRHNFDAALIAYHNK